MPAAAAIELVHASSLILDDLPAMDDAPFDDPAGNYVPSLKGREVIASFNEKDGTYTTRPAKQEMTIRHLLTHTSGLGYPFTSYTVLGIQQKAGTNPVDMPLLFDPGTKWTYSASTAVLGTVVEKLSGQTIEEFDQAKIFHPLGMVDTSYYLPDDKARRLATIHQRETTGLVENPNAAKSTHRRYGVTADCCQPPRTTPRSCKCS